MDGFVKTLFHVLSSLRLLLFSGQLSRQIAWPKEGDVNFLLSAPKQP